MEDYSRFWEKTARIALAYHYIHNLMYFFDVFLKQDTTASRRTVNSQLYYIYILVSADTLHSNASQYLQLTSVTQAQSYTAWGQ